MLRAGRSQGTNRLAAAGVTYHSDFFLDSEVCVVDGVPRLPPLALGAQAASWIEMCEAVQKFRRGGVAVI